MIEYKRQPGTNLVEVQVLNASSVEDFDWLAAQIETDTKRHQQLCILEEIHSLEGINPLTFWKDTRFGFSYNKRFRRAAIVVEPKWVSFFERVAESVLSVEVGVYDHTQIESARQWLSEKTTPRAIQSDCHALMTINHRAAIPKTSIAA